MKSFRTDLHIHTVLSPCSDLEMSPARIVSLARRQGLEIIGITDHNSTKQCEMVWKLGQKSGLAVIPGCEITSREEVHSLALFSDFDALAVFQNFLDQHLTVILNNPDLFGYQVLVDENGNILEEQVNYLGASLDVSIEEVEQKVHELSGIFIPAHIDRSRNSIFSQLGFIPPELKVDALQISKLAQEKTIRENYRISPEITLVKFSDAHYPGDLGKTFTLFEIESPTFGELRKAMYNEDGRRSLIPNPSPQEKGVR
ncbi:MAG: PHP domain-containing protein [Bacteroidota bacterium]|nr:histidinol-phosphatase [Odoribacter sp.]MDP3642990.1 PHP domain-containing protein [Bacteroidota bacterium]